MNVSENKTLLFQNSPIQKYTPLKINIIGKLKQTFQVCWSVIEKVPIKRPLWMLKMLQGKYHLHFY
jgi:hypothetical protein